MTDATGSTSYTPDGAGRITSVTTPNGTVGYGFDTANRRTSMSVTGTGSWSYSYDAGDRLTQIVNPSSENSYFSYDAANRQTGQTNGNASTATTTFDNANRPTEILHKDSSSTTLADYQYAYDGVGNVTSRTDSDGTVTSFGYDASDQLTSEVRDNSHSTGYALGYSYDHNANRLTKVVGTRGSAVTTTNTYGTHNQLLTSGSSGIICILSQKEERSYVNRNLGRTNGDVGNPTGHITTATRGAVATKSNQKKVWLAALAAAKNSSTQVLMKLT